MKKKAWQTDLTYARQRVSNTSLIRAWRMAVLKRDNNMCRVCGAQEKLTVHHIRPVRDVINTLLIYDINNGITLCKKCHDKTLNKESNFIEMFDAIVADEHVAYLFEPDDVSTADSGVSSESPFDVVRGRWCAQHPVKSTHCSLTDEDVRLLDERRAYIAQLEAEYEKKMRPVRKKRERALKLCYSYMYPLPNQKKILIG